MDGEEGRCGKYSLQLEMRGSFSSKSFWQVSVSGPIHIFIQRLVWCLMSVVQPFKLINMHKLNVLLSLTWCHYCSVQWRLLTSHCAFKSIAPQRWLGAISLAMFRWWITCSSGPQPGERDPLQVVASYILGVARWLTGKGRKSIFRRITV